MTAEVWAAIAAGLSAVTLVLVIVLLSKAGKGGGVAVTDFGIDKQLEKLYAALNANTKALTEQEMRLNTKIAEGALATETRLNAMREKLDGELKYMLENNERNLEKIRCTVDDKLASTLEGKLSESYKIINERLEAVYKGIGEVNTLAVSVADIKKVFTNVKLRGTWGEVQLSALLGQMLAPGQYAASVKVNPAENVMVDFAVKVPSRDEAVIYLPIDSKFPVEEYMRLVDAPDKESAAAALKNFGKAVKLQADKIAEKYIVPPFTTDFAVMYLPLEGLYAEVVKMTELEAYLRNRRIMVCGPTNLGALLSTFQTGFKTVAIEKRSGELWQLLSAFKTEFERFAAILDKTQKKLQEAQDIVDSASKKTRTISRKLKNVADIGGEDADRLLSDGDD